MNFKPRLIILFAINLALLVLAILWLKSSSATIEPLIFTLSWIASLFTYVQLAKNIYKQFRDKLLEYNIEYPFWAFVVAVGIIVFLWYSGLMESYKNDPLGGIMVEFHGMAFDIIILSVGFAIYDTIKSRKEKIKKYLEEIDDFRRWKEPEAAFRIAGIIKRLNALGVTKMDLHDCFLSGSDLVGITLTKGTNMKACKMIGTDLSGATFIEVDLSERADLSSSNLYKATIQDSNLTTTIFDNANMTETKVVRCNCDKTKIRAVMTNAEFKETVFTKARFSSTPTQGKLNLQKDAYLKNTGFINCTFDDIDNFNWINEYTNFLNAKFKNVTIDERAMKILDKYNITIE